ncbi:MAG: DNA primase DnaG [Natronomonas sp.]
MQDTAKYLIRADITADGVVERSDVVGAVFGQTEGLLGEELDLRELQDSSKVGRIDVEIESKGGQSFGRITIATSLDQIETAILAAALETIERVGPCRSTIEIRTIEDVRAAKRSEIVDRAAALLTDAFDGSQTSRDLVEEVREAVRIADITDYEGLPAGPNVADADAIIVVEGRADVLRLLQYGIKNAVAVEGTDVPEAIAELTAERTTTAFLDGDRGGELILRELTQVGNVDYVAFAPDDESVEDLSRRDVMKALREKVPYDRVSTDEFPDSPEEIVTDTDGLSAEPISGTSESTTDPSGIDVEANDGESAAVSSGTAGSNATSPSSTAESAASAASPRNQSTDGTADAGVESATGADTDDEPATLRGHVAAVIEAESGTVRLLDESFAVVDSVDADDAFDALEAAESTPTAVVLDGELTQRILDVAAQRGVDQIVARSEGSFVKKPTSVRVRTASELLAGEVET